MTRTPGLTEIQDQIRKLLNDGETLTIEFKDDQRDFSDSQIYEAVVAMTNTAGGSIFVGVTDSGKIVGSKRISEGSWTPEILAGKIMANTIPACATVVSVENIDSRTILVIRIPKSLTTTGTKSGKFLKRALDATGKPQNIPMTADDILSGISRTGVQDFSSTVLTSTDINDLNLKLIEETAKKRVSQVTDPHHKEVLSQPPQVLLNSYGLLFDGKTPNIAALLLFGRSEVLRERLPSHGVQYQVFGERGELFKNTPFNGPIAEIFPKLLELPETLRNSDEFRFRGANVVIPEYPEDSRREAFANAIVHRDYTLQPGIQIQLFEKELWVVSPGCFLTGVNLNNLLSVAPTPRNRRLAEAMRSFGLVESSGRGIDFIYQGQARFGRPAPDYSGSDSFRVSVRLSGGKANLDFCRFILESAPNSSMIELLLLNTLFFRGDLSVEELAHIIQKPTSVTQEILAKLQQDQLIDISLSKTPLFFIKSRINNSSLHLAKPTRLSRSQIEKFKESLLNELKRKSPNTVTVPAKAVGLSPSQTRRLLVQLREENRIQLLSNKRWKYFN